MEKVKIDTEVRTLDMLCAAHINRQYEIGQKVRDLPERIESSRQYHAGLMEDITTRSAHEEGGFAMMVGSVTFTGRKAREEAGAALLKAITASLWEGGKQLQLNRLGSFKGFTVMSSFSGQEGEMPKLYLRGRHTYEVNLNPENASGTIASMEHALRRLDREAEKEHSELERREKTLADLKEQQHHPFEHEERLRELLLKQQDINRQLDLDKGDPQVAANDNIEPEEDDKAESTFAERVAVERRKGRVVEPAA